MRGRHMKCAAAGWVAGWAVAVFVPSLLIAWAGIPAAGWRLERLAADSWQTADTMGPGAKLLLGGLLALLFWGAHRLARSGRAARYGLAAVAGVVAMLLTLLLIPVDWSRGFGIGLTGARLSTHLLPFYLSGAALAGVVQAWSMARCTSQLG